jgi:hypothetical protein
LLLKLSNLNLGAVGKVKTHTTEHLGKVTSGVQSYKKKKHWGREQRIVMSGKGVVSKII